MDHPYNGVRLRRHNSLPALHHKLTPRKVVTTASVDKSSRKPIIGVRIPLFMSSSKTNPYIGSFRHAPPTSFTTMRNRGTNSVFACPVAGLAPGGKSSPYIGWFRHAPPSSNPYYQQQEQRQKYQWMQSKVFSSSNVMDNSLSHDGGCEDLLRILQLLQPSSVSTTVPKTTSIISTVTSKRMMVDGYLRGGGPVSTSGHERDPSFDSPLDDDDGSESSATLQILTRLSSWFLFPLAYDAESCGYGDRLHKAPLSLKASQCATTILEANEDDESDGDSDDGDDRSSSSSTVTGSVSYDRETHPPISPTKLSPLTLSMNQLDVPVSEIAQAYYAHQATSSSSFDNDLDTSKSIRCNPMEVSDLTTPFGLSQTFSNRWDYVITQQDIARMARNASRHLDVESILNLPTMTYRSPSKKQHGQGSQDKSNRGSTFKSGITNASSQVTAPAGTTSKTPNEFWSWMMVRPSQAIEDAIREESESQALDSESSVMHAEGGTDTENQDQVCVICLEHFADGDRLRVLPCNHSFHVGCIDRWLSGSHSHHECFTSGCPTCKERPLGARKATSAAVEARRIVAQEDTSTAPPVYRVIQEDDDDHQDELNGSVPSWAFTQLGSAMARSAYSQS